MINTHEREKKQFRRLFQQQGIDQFDLRFEVLDAFLNLEHHVSIREIVDLLKKDGRNLDDGFVIHTMDLLCRFGFANRIEFEGRTPRYEHQHLGHHHDHMICTKCGKILEFRDEAIEIKQREVAKAYGFHMLQHKMEIYGICDECMESRQKLVPLSKAKPGEKLMIKEFETGRNIQARMSSMGLKSGDMIEMVSNGFGGQVVIAIGENRLVIGGGMAEKIRVKPVKPMQKPEDMPPHLFPGEATGKVMPLSKMKTGQEGVIRKVGGEGVFRRRLLEMGINRGARIYVEKYAPLRDPLELVIKGYHVSLRVEEAANVLVENVRFASK